MGNLCLTLAHKHRVLPAHCFSTAEILLSRAQPAPAVCSPWSPAGRSLSDLLSGPLLPPGSLCCAVSSNPSSCLLSHPCLLASHLQPLAAIGPSGAVWSCPFGAGLCVWTTHRCFLTPSIWDWLQGEEAMAAKWPQTNQWSLHGRPPAWSPQPFHHSLA